MATKEGQGENARTIGEKFKLTYINPLPPLPRLRIHIALFIRRRRCKQTRPPSNGTTQRYSPSRPPAYLPPLQSRVVESRPAPREELMLSKLRKSSHDSTYHVVAILKKNEFNGLLGRNKDSYSYTRLESLKLTRSRRYQLNSTRLKSTSKVDLGSHRCNMRPTRFTRVVAALVLRGGSDVPAWARPESPGFGLGSALKTPRPSPSQAPKSPSFGPSRGFCLVNFRKWGPGLAKFQAEPEPELSEAGLSRAQAEKPGLRGLRPKPEHHYVEGPR
ncbi:hypothetical protein C8J57DRAFT_1234036 [Mycena rebaudengoi]|nr:hypothetical protein C8J57DRAFT_1234036 [Mycena rebaudengoi]